MLSSNRNRHDLLRIHLFTLALLVSLICPGVTVAQETQPTATLTELSGTVTVIIRGAEQPAERNAILTESDEIVLAAGAAATLALSDGSVVQLSENTRLQLGLLLETPEKARKSRNDLSEFL